MNHPENHVDMRDPAFIERGMNIVQAATRGLKLASSADCYKVLAVLSWACAQVAKNIDDKWSRVADQSTLSVLTEGAEGIYADLAKPNPDHPFHPEEMN